MKQKRKHRSPGGETVLSGGERSRLLRYVLRPFGQLRYNVLFIVRSNERRVPRILTETTSHIDQTYTRSFVCQPKYCTRHAEKVSTKHIILRDYSGHSALREAARVAIYTTFAET